MTNICLCVRLAALLVFCMPFALQGQPRPFTVVGPSDPKPYEQTAQKDLETYLSRMAQDRQVLVGGRDAVRFHVGETEFAKARTLGSKDLKDEEWVVRSFGRDVVVNGGGTHGALYAVYHFLEDACGVRFWNDEETDVPPERVMSFEFLDLHGRPAFVSRDIHRGCDKRYTPAFAVRRRLNNNDGVPIPVEYGGSVGYGPPCSCHTHDRLISWSKYGKTHPEWFSLWKGKRVGGVIDGQLCISNPEVRALLKDRVVENVRNGMKSAREQGLPAPRFYDLSINDTANYCECAECTKEVLAYGHSGANLRLVNEVAEAVAALDPNAYVTMLAYHHLEEPPRGGIVPRDNVIIRLCDTKSDSSSSILSPTNAPFSKLLADWSAISKNLFVWDYAVLFVNPSLCFPFASEFTYSDLYRRFRDCHVKGVFLEHEFSDVSDMFDLKYYLETKLMEDPDLDADAVIDDFMNGYFGAAGKVVLKARRHLWSCRQKRDTDIRFFPQPDAFRYITTEDLEYMRGLWNQAEDLVKDDARRLKRVRRCRNSQDALWRFRQSEPEKRGDVFVYGPRALQFSNTNAVSFAACLDAPGGEALVVDLDKVGGNPFRAPVFFAIHDPQIKQTVSSGHIPVPSEEGFRWYEAKNVLMPAHCQNTFYISTAWTLHMPIYHPELMGRTCTVRFLVKFSGPRYRDGTKGANLFSVARMEFVREK